MARTVLGIIASPKDADKAVEELKKAGFSSDDISVIVKEEAKMAAVEETRGGKIAKDAASGAATGGAIGGIAGLIIGIAAIAIPGIGGIIAAGPLSIALGLTGVGTTTLAGAITGAAAGGLIGGLVGIGVPRKHAEIYEEAIKKGQVLLAVSTTDENEKQATEIFEKHGAAQVCSIASKE